MHESGSHLQKSNICGCLHQLVHHLLLHDLVVASETSKTDHGHLCHLVQHKVGRVVKSAPTVEREKKVGRRCDES